MLCTLVTSVTPRPAVASGSGNVHANKTVTSATFHPNLGLTLTVDHSHAIPGDHLAYRATVTNTGATLTVTGDFVAGNSESTTATLASYWDEIATTANPGQGCATNHGHDVSQWPPLVGTVASLPGYVPDVLPVVSSGISVSLTPVPASGVTYPSGGDKILGTTIGAGKTARWHYVATAVLTPAQATFLANHQNVAKTRNTLHLEVLPRDANAAQPAFVDVCSPGVFGVSPTPSAAIRNVGVTINPPEGASPQTFTPATTLALGSLASGASVTVTGTYTVPAVAAKGSNESDDAYGTRLEGINGTTLSANASATGTTSGGPVSAGPATASTTEQLPVVTISKTGPATAAAGSTASYPLGLINMGDATASGMTITDVVSGGATGTVTDVPTTISPGSSATAAATYAIPGTEAGGPLPDTASVSWKDANGNAYGPLSSLFTTQVTASGPPLIDVKTNTVTGNFFAEDPNATSFVAKPGDTAAFSQQFPTIDFNPPPGKVPHNLSGVDDTTRPFTDITTTPSGDFSGTIVAQGGGVQAGVGQLAGFDAEFTSIFNVSQPSDVTFTFYHDDGFLLGVGNGASRVNGALENTPATTPFQGYTVAGGCDERPTGGSGFCSANTDSVTVHFPAAGSYPYELDYFEAGNDNLSLTMTQGSVASNSSPLSIYVGYADSLRPSNSIFPNPWAGSPNVIFEGCAGCTFDAGVMRFDNNTANAITIDSVTVNVGGGLYDPWPHAVTVPPGQILIFGNPNFDSSDFDGVFNCTPDGVIPQVHVTIGGVTTTYADTGQVLNTGGFDLACFGNESYAWQQIGAAGQTSSPRPRWAPSMAYDAGHNESVLLGGSAPDASHPTSDTWTFDGTKWTPQSPTNGPSARDGAAMAYDAVTKTVVLFGGATSTSTETNDTWTWDGTNWTQAHPATSPPSVDDASMTYDPIHQQIVLVVAPNEATTDFETWTWDGTNWTEHTQSGGPSARTTPGLAFDPALNGVVMFGGFTDTGSSATDLKDTWLWNGTSWSQLTTSSAPPPRNAAAMAYDATTQSIVLFGGLELAPTFQMYGDTWTFDGHNWTQHHPAASPALRAQAGFVFDNTTGQPTLFGGATFDSSNNPTNVYGDTWTWDGLTWNGVGPRPVPSASTLSITPTSTGLASLSATVGQTRTFTATLSDPAGTPLAGLPVVFTVNGANPQGPTPITTDSTGGAPFPYVGQNGGTDTIQAAAQVNGTTVVSNVVSLNWQVPVTGPPPTIEPTTSPLDGDKVTKPTPVAAVITPPSGQTIASWGVTYQAQDAEPPVPLASGTGTPPNPLATFDPTLLANDTYAITITATASGGGTQTLTTTVAVYGNLKLGRYTTTYQDLSVPVNGFQMEVRRTYDSTDKRVGDFGVGWHVDVSNFRVSSNRQLGAQGWTEYSTGCFILCNWAYKTSTPHYVTVTYPDGHQEVFDFTPTGPQNSLFDYFGATTAFTPRAGTNTTSTLQDARGPVNLSNGWDGNLYDSNGLPYNPTRFKLTTHDGRAFVLDVNTGLVSETDPNGNTLTVDNLGIHASNGQSITYSRDGLGRITQIVGPSGQTWTYSYSSAGDLASSADPNGNTTTYSYDSSHDLLGAKGPGGQPLQAQTYLDGRLASITDANGHTVTVTDNVSGQQQTIVDPAGKLTTLLTFDDLGDVVQRQDVFDTKTLTTSFTYDSLGRPTGRKDPLGHTWTGSYDPAGDLLGLTSPGSHAASLAYGGNANPLSYADPNGQTTNFAYDSALNLTSVTDALGRPETYTYDGAGHPITRTDRAGHVWSATYDANGNLASSTDPLGHTTSYVYDSTGRLVKQTDPLGAVTGYSYDNNGNLTAKTDPNGHTTTYTYDNLNRLVSRTAADGGVTKWAYDGVGNVLTKTDPLRRTTTYSYDLDSRLSSVTDPTGGVTTYTYDGEGRLISQTDPLGRVTGYAYDDAGRQIKTTNPAGGTTTTAYDSENHPLTVTDPLGHTTTNGYDAAGQLTSVTDPLGRTTTYQLDALGEQTGIVNPAGQTTTQTFDPLGNIAAVTNPAGETTTSAYDPAGNVASTTDPIGRTTSNTYDSANRLIATTDPAAHTTSYGYDAAGNQTSVTDALGHTTTYGYDALNRQTSVTDALGHTQMTAYDPAGQVASTADGLAHLTSYTYDGAGRRTSITDALGGKVAFGYDAAGQQTSTTDPNNNTTTSTYDPLGDVASTTDPLGRATTSTYDAHGELVSRTDERNITTTYRYDAAGQLTSQNAPGRPVTFSYDLLGRRATMADVTGTTTYGYDPAGRTTSDASPQGTVSYSYDHAGQRTTMTSPGGHTVSYGYDPASNLTSLKDWLNNTITYGYDADNHPTSTVRPNGVTTAFSYDNAGHVTGVNHTGPGGSLGNYTYSYDAAGNRVSFTSAAGTETYTLDNLNRLTKAAYPNGDVISYTYDAAGNRTSQTVNGITTSATFDKANQLTKNGGTTYTYDGAGNLATAGANTFSWDSAGHLASSTVAGSTTAYAYNGNGLRTSATTGTTTTPYLWDSQAALPTLIGDGTNSYIQAQSGAQEQVGPSNTTAYPLADAVGSVRSVTNATGASIGTSSYDAYGPARTTSGTTSIFGYTGQQTDATGLLYLRARYLDPTVGRFLSQDTVVPSGSGTQAYNRYSYTDDNPTTATDPTGNGPVVDFAIRVAQIAGQVARLAGYAYCAYSVYKAASGPSVATVANAAGACSRNPLLMLAFCAWTVFSTDPSTFGGKFSIGLACIGPALHAWGGHIGGGDHGPQDPTPDPPSPNEPANGPPPDSFVHNNAASNAPYDPSWTTKQKGDAGDAAAERDFEQQGPNRVAVGNQVTLDVTLSNGQVVTVRPDVFGWTETDPPTFTAIEAKNGRSATYTENQCLAYRAIADGTYTSVTVRADELRSGIPKMFSLDPGQLSFELYAYNGAHPQSSC
jgi:RHS repeat-associated protein